MKLGIRAWRWAVAWLLLTAPLAAGAHPGQPDHIWTGSPATFPQFCVQIYSPVHDALGKTYLNACVAASVGARVTWDGVAH